MHRDLGLALKRDEFVLHYQPQIEITTGQVVGAEALIRWHHPELGLLGPDLFIPAAEDSGLIRTIGEWVIRTVGSDMQAWREAGLPRLRIAINVSALQIARPQHIDALRAVVTAAGMAHADSDFEIEITESNLMTGEHARAAVSALKDLGLTLAIDDFGTGYSSMMALKQLPIDCIKIDRSFIKNLPDDANDAAMTVALIAMGKALGLRLLAEGVETAAQLAFLRAHGCDEVQGFLFSKALPIAAFRTFLENDGAALAAPQGGAPGASGEIATEA
jgi:EAL domain-containing protein (putative c-di-GMP-specific phosphodiesterase class I)